MAAKLPTAVVVYLRELREARGFTQESLAEAANIGKRSVERLEQRRGPMALGSFERVIAVLGASADEVNYLMTHPAATDDEAIELARARIERDPTFPRISSRGLASRSDVSLSGIQTYVRVLREYQGISRKTLADDLGIGIAALADWESGQSSTLPFSLLVRALAYLGGTIEDLERIGAAVDRHETLGRTLAEERVTAAPQRRQPAPQRQLAIGSGPAPEWAIMRRLAAIEAVLHYLLDLLKRLFPGEAEAIDHASAYWCRMAAADDER